MDAELALGPRDAELLDEDRAELVVVVLAGVDEQLLVLARAAARETAAALTNCGRLPMTVTIRTGQRAAAPSSCAICARTRSSASRVSGPGAAGERAPSIAWTGSTSRDRRREERLLHVGEVVAR